MLSTVQSDIGRFYVLFINKLFAKFITIAEISFQEHQKKPQELVLGSEMNRNKPIKIPR